MSTPSKKRQVELEKDEHDVFRLYENACIQWGKEKVDKDHTRIWDLRCMYGMRNIIPFGSMVSKSLSDVLWVAENICDIWKK